MNNVARGLRLVAHLSWLFLVAGTVRLALAVIRSEWGRTMTELGICMSLVLDDLPGKKYRQTERARHKFIGAVMMSVGFAAGGALLFGDAQFRAITLGALMAASAFLLGMANAVRAAVRDAEVAAPLKRAAPLRKLTRLADWLGLDTRRAVKALAGDYAAEIRRLRRERRQWAARWNVCLAWGYAAWYVLRSPVDVVLRYLVRVWRG